MQKELDAFYTTPADIQELTKKAEMIEVQNAINDNIYRLKTNSII